MSSPELGTTQDSGSEDETFWDEDKAREDNIGAAFGGASIAGASSSPSPFILAFRCKHMRSTLAPLTLPQHKLCLIPAAVASPAYSAKANPAG